VYKRTPARNWVSVLQTVDTVLSLSYPNSQIIKTYCYENIKSSECAHDTKCETSPYCLNVLNLVENPDTYFTFYDASPLWKSQEINTVYNMRGRTAPVQDFRLFAQPYVWTSQTAVLAAKRRSRLQFYTLKLTVIFITNSLYMWELQPRTSTTFMQNILFRKLFISLLSCKLVISFVWNYKWMTWKVKRTAGLFGLVTRQGYWQKLSSV
jgi:hypothetical protein